MTIFLSLGTRLQFTVHTYLRYRAPKTMSRSSQRIGYNYTHVFHLTSSKPHFHFHFHLLTGPYPYQ
jgi:hypothetical protein